MPGKVSRIKNTAPTSWRHRMIFYPETNGNEPDPGRAERFHSFAMKKRTGMNSKKRNIVTGNIKMITKAFPLPVIIPHGIFLPKVKK